MRHRTLAWIVAGLIVVGGAVAYLGWARWLAPEPLPLPGSPEYLAYVRAFRVGVAALESSKQTNLAKLRLEEATAIIPAEPAAWADLALLYLRSNQTSEAAKALFRAKELAPPGSPEIEELLGLFARQHGQIPEAVDHLQKAVDREPRNLWLIFLLAQTIEQEGGPNVDRDLLRLMDKVLAFDPNNLRALLARALAANHLHDEAAFRDCLDRLERLAPSWLAQSRRQLDVLKRMVAKKPNDVPIELNRLHNLLKQERGYRRGTGNIREDAQEGTVIHHFLRLRQPPAAPAEPDGALSFMVGPWTGAPAELGKTRWDLLHLHWRIRNAQLASVTKAATDGGIFIPPAREFEPIIWLGAGPELRQTGSATVHAFPCGPKGVAASVDGVLSFDWDNDLRTDLLLAGAGGLRFLHAQPAGTFADVTERTGLPKDVLTAECYGAWAVDIEMDGDLDVIVARRDGPPFVLRNHGDGTFQRLEIPEFAALRAVRAFVWADLDNDGACDAIFLDAAGKLHVFANERFAQFSPWPLPADLGTLHAVTAGDVNDDGVFDLVGLKPDGTLLRLSDVEHRQSWQTATLAQSAAPEGAIGTTTLFVEDLDNNGALDVLVAGPHAAQVFLADAQGNFRALAAPLPLQVFALLDLNGDGLLDLLGLSAEGQPMQALGVSKLGYHGEQLFPLANPKGAGDNRNNSFALGGELEISAGLLVQKQRITSPRVHFGLGTETKIDVIRCVWPSGEPQFEFEPVSDPRLMLAQRLNGSCPFLFTYDGTTMRFAGDCLWNTPLGMFVNGQAVDSFAQTTEWLKVPSDALVPNQGIYDLRIHANLWEIDFFDQVGLLVVDHPPETEVYVDERFFLTPTPPQLYVTTPARPVAHAWDHLGHDATDEILAVDGRYLDRAGRGKYQGITADHWVEADLGDDAPKDGPVYLVARGWTHPTDSSINVAISQGRHDAPQPLVLEVPDGKGGWRVGRPALGFPAGKNKTILIRLDGIDGLGVSRRFRLRTNMEIYWDFLGYARGLDPSLARVQRPTLQSADLRYRGTLEMTQKDASSPELPVYDRVSKGRQAWRDLHGYYTRFGAVRELLDKVDDRYVIMNAGDEIALKYVAPAAPAPGWRRDYVFECDGWTRDGNANTRFGTTVLPLPMHGLKSLDQPPGALTDDPVYRRFPDDWLRYHTRYVSTDDFERGLRKKR